MSSKKKYYLEMEDGTKEYVSEKVFKEYWKLVNRENYLRKLDRKQKIMSLNVSDVDGREFGETLESGFDVEKIVETAELIKELHNAINSLNEDEKELIERLFFKKESLRKIAKDKGVVKRSIEKRRDSIFIKLRKKLKNFKF